MIRKIASIVIGVLAIIALCGAGLVYSNDQAHHLSADKAELVSSMYTIGTPFGGSAQSVSVENGALVKPGQEVLRLQSATLQQARETARFNEAGVGYHMEGSDVIVFTATSEGRIRGLEIGAGSFVMANTIMATVDIADTLALSASFTMSARDYARLSIGAPVTVDLPDSTSVVAEVFDVQFKASNNDGAATIIKARSTDLKSKSHFTSGAPVTARLKLDNDEDPGSWISRQLLKLVTPSGFRD